MTKLLADPPPRLLRKFLKRDLTCMHTGIYPGAPMAVRLGGAETFKGTNSVARELR